MRSIRVEGPLYSDVSNHHARVYGDSIHPIESDSTATPFSEVARIFKRNGRVKKVVVTIGDDEFTYTDMFMPEEREGVKP